MSTTPSSALVAAAAATEAGTSPGSEEPLTIYAMIQQQQEMVAKALPRGLDPERFVRMVLTEVRKTPNLANCAPATVMAAMMLAAQLGLEPGGPLGQCYLIPRWSTKRNCFECSFQLGYRGIVQLAARAGVTLTARTVRVGDSFDWQYGTTEYLTHRPLIDTSRESEAWYAVAHFPDGRPPIFTVIDRNIAERARAAGQSGDLGPWKTWYDAMAEKTAAIRLSRWLPLTAEGAYAIEADGVVMSGLDVSLEEAAATAKAERDEADAAVAAELQGADAEPEPEPTLDADEDRT